MCHSPSPESHFVIQDVTLYKLDSDCDFIAFVFFFLQIKLCL
jgi:hypothetical protein